MKYSTTRTAAVLSSVITSLLLSACGEKVLDYRNAEVVNGALYAHGANEPFSGKVTNVLAATVFGAQAGFNTLLNTLKNIDPMDTIGGTGLISICDVSTNKGVLDGAVSCKPPRTDTVQLEATFSNGVLDGNLTLHDETGTHTLLELAFKDGQPDGIMKLYSPATDKLTHTVEWKAGVLNGGEDGFDPQTGNRILHATYLNGALEGEMTQYAADGKTLTFKGTFERGLANGEVDKLDPRSGIRSVDHYTDGQLDGVSQAWDASGKLIAEKTFTNGEDAVQKQKEEEKERLGKEVDVAINDPDPAVKACVNSYPWSKAVTPSDDEAIEEDRKILAWRDECRANANSHPAVDRSITQSKTVPTTQYNNSIQPEVVQVPVRAAPDSAIVSDGPASARCGWIDNAMPSSLTLQDRDGVWHIVGGKTVGNPVGFDNSMPPTEKGRSCGCLKIETNRQAMQVVKIVSGSLKPVSACQSDKRLNQQ